MPTREMAARRKNGILASLCRDIAVRRSRAVSFSSPCLLPTAQVISWCGTSIACGRSTRRFKKGIRSRRLLSASCRTTCTPYDPCRKVMRTFHCAGALSRAVSLAGSPATDGGQPAKSPNATKEFGSVAIGSTLSATTRISRAMSIIFTLIQ